MSFDDRRHRRLPWVILPTDLGFLLRRRRPVSHYRGAFGFFIHGIGVSLLPHANRRRTTSAIKAAVHDVYVVLSVKG